MLSSPEMDVPDSIEYPGPQAHLAPILPASNSAQDGDLAESVCDSWPHSDKSEPSQTVDSANGVEGPKIGEIIIIT